MIRQGQRIRYWQVPHCVPLPSHNECIPVHDNPKAGEGVVSFTLNEKRVFARPDSYKGDGEVLLLLRVPPDVVEVI